MQLANWMQKTFLRRIVFGMALALTICLMGKGQAYAASDESKQELRKELLEMLMTADSSVHNVSAYKMNLREINQVWDDLVANEGYLAYHMYGGTCPLPYSYGNGKIVNEMYVFGLDGDKAGFEQRYARASKHIENVKNATEGMSDAEKVLYAHDYLVDISYYKNNKGALISKAAGPLGLGYGICGGYADSMDVLLKSIGVDSFSEISQDMCHIWNAVKVDEEWYQLDATWDDTRSSSKGEVSHYFMLRNDAEFQSALSSRHYGWEAYDTRLPQVSSESTVYENWFVHDTVGRMYYEDGLWYYVDNKTGNIVRSQIGVDQSEYEIVVDRQEENGEKLQIKNVAGNKIFYMAGDNAKEIDLNRKSNINRDDILSVHEKWEWNQIGYWREGHYSLKSGAYEQCIGRICLNDYIDVKPETKYFVSVNNSKYHVLVRELDENKTCIETHNISFNEKIKTKDATKYFGISLYSPDNQDMTYEEYITAFNSGLSVTVKECEAEQVDTTVNVNSTLNWNEKKYWKRGQYSLEEGIYQENDTRICLLDYIAIDSSMGYQVMLPDRSGCRMLIRELDENKNFLASYNLAGYQIYEPANNARYIGISIYFSGNANSQYEDYLSVITSGIGLNQVERQDELPIEELETQELETEEVTEDVSEEETEQEVTEDEEVEEKSEEKTEDIQQESTSDNVQEESTPDEINSEEAEQQETEAASDLVIEETELENTQPESAEENSTEDIEE